MNGATGPRAAEPKGNGVRAVQSAGHARGKQPSSGQVYHGVVDLGFRTKVSRQRQSMVRCSLQHVNAVLAKSICG
jgi:hypothetical protein